MGQVLNVLGSMMNQGQQGQNGGPLQNFLGGNTNSPYNAGQQPGTNSAYPGQNTTTGTDTTYPAYEGPSGGSVGTEFGKNPGGGTLELPGWAENSNPGEFQLGGELFGPAAPQQK